MTTNRALVLSIGSFVVFVAAIFLIFAMLDVRPLFAIGPVVAVGVASIGVYRAARDDV